ncbi:transcriptional regulator, LacI family [Pseudonocardia ammonioxydans]|uniref:Transcriptional regulator, LacI family n=1 Tax=Pseudonocardia ammonioxydans TaxID=260086 RepID=A0A1I5C5N1_PSUAM|nr:LacI family DNA-binding transcriptional regulator [Pseudonocardia ammonioxydans]SFN82305.1 transcriptional regulator, LacI family [Pseudonocardia ammonioxydans]
MDGAGASRVTAAMVAERAGTSVSTVSLVVNGKSRGRVSAAITERVRAAVDELGYVVDHAASSLARGRTDLVVLLAPDLPNPYFGRVTTGIRDGLGDRHQLMQSVIAGGEQPTAEDVRRIAAFRPAGLLVHAPAPSFLDELDPCGPPLVLLDAPGFETRAATVTFDLRPGVRALVGHLAAAGHRTVAYLDGTTPSATFALRRSLLRETAAEHGVTVLDGGGGDVRAGLTLDAAADTAVTALPGWLDDGATAVVAAADTLAYGLLAAAHRLGLDVPGDVAVAGFDDLPYSQVTAPSLTSVALPAEELGRAAAHRLTALLAGTDTPGPPPLPTRLAVRASTAP